jgi:hypothetical protein
VRTDFTVKNGRVATENLTLDVAKLPVVLAGWTDFDGQVNYGLRADGLSEKLPAKAKNILADLEIDLASLADDVKVRGTVAAPVVTVGGVPIDTLDGAEPDRRPDNRQRLREIGRRLRHRVIR